MERVRDMVLGFMVYLLILGGLYVVSDPAQSTGQLDEPQVAGQQKKMPDKLERVSSPFVGTESIVSVTSNTRTERKVYATGVQKASTLSFFHNEKIFLNQRNFLEIIPFTEN